MVTIISMLIKVHKSITDEISNNAFEPYSVGWIVIFKLGFLAQRFFNVGRYSQIGTFFPFFKKWFLTFPTLPLKYTKENSQNTKEILNFFDFLFWHKNSFFSYFKAGGCIAEVLTVL